MNPESQSTDRAITVRFKRSITVERLLFLALAMTLLLLAACGPTNPSAPGSTPSAEEVLEQARQAMDAVQSYRFTGVINIIADEDVPDTRVEGVWASPGDSRVQIRQAGYDDTIIQEFISVGGRTMARIPESSGGGWIRGGSGPGWVPTNDLMFPELDDTEMADGGTIDGRTMYRVTGLRKVEEQPPAMSYVSHYSLFVDQETMRLRRLVIDTELTGNSPEGGATGRYPVEEIKIRQSVVYDYFDYNEPVVIALPPIDPCTRTAETKERLQCDRLAHRVYWLGDRLKITGSPDLEFDGTWINFGNNDDLITEDSRLMVVYASPKNTDGGTTVYLELWSRPGWDDFMAQFSGFDPRTVPTSGTINWWQHPCVEEEVYNEINGAQVRLFKAHLPSLIYIRPMTEEQVSQCLNEPIGAVGAHVYFEETVIEFSVQDSVTPAGPPATPYVSVPGATPRVEAPKTYPELVLRSRNPYNNVETVRSIAASLTPCEKP